jgi:hypothetical protein
MRLSYLTFVSSNCNGGTTKGLPRALGVMVAASYVKSCCGLAADWPLGAPIVASNKKLATGPFMRLRWCKPSHSATNRLRRTGVARQLPLNEKGHSASS